MTDIEVLKEQRNASKIRLTDKLKNLKTSLQNKDPSFKALYLIVDTEYDNLFDLDLQVSELEDCESTYLNDVNPHYHEVIKMYFDALKEEQEVERDRILKQIIISVEESIVDLEPVLARSNAILAHENWENLTESQYFELESNIAIINSDISSIEEEVVKAIYED